MAVKKQPLKSQAKNLKYSHYNHLGRSFWKSSLDLSLPFNPKRISIDKFLSNNNICKKIISKLTVNQATMSKSLAK